MLEQSECINTFSQDGQEEIEVLVHGASNLHTKRKDDTIPRAFVSLKVRLRISCSSMLGLEVRLF